MKMKLTAKGMTTSRLTLQGFGLSDSELSTLLNGVTIDVSQQTFDAISKHEMAVKAAKKDEVDDGSGNT